MKRVYIIYFIIFAFLASCTDDFEDFNKDEKNPINVEGEFLFSQGQKELSDQISSTNVNLNVWKLFAQYWTETTYTDEANYDIVNRTIPDNVFDIYYTNVLKHLDNARELIEEDPLTVEESEAQKFNKLLIIELMKIYTYHNLVNIFGNVPYDSSLNVDNISPKYDDAAYIYSDLMTRVDNVINNLEPSAASFGSADLIYGGDAEKWMKFANSLKLKIAINVADASGDVDFNVQAKAEEAVAAGVIASASDNALFVYQGSSPNTNPLYEDLVLSGRKDFVAANTIIDAMVPRDDPRLDNFFQHKVDTSDNDVDDPVWLGGQYGYSSSYQNHSRVGAKIVDDPTFPGLFITYSEVQFYLAEAAARGYNVGVSAEDAYDEGVKASIKFWDGTDAEADDYLDNNPYDEDDWKASIGLQSWLASYTRGFIGYTTYRRLDEPNIMNTPDPDVYKTEDGVVPRRFTYPINEQTLNRSNYQEASDAIGGDALETTLFWDISTP